MIRYEKEITAYFGIPSVPRKAWDGRSSFAKAVAVVELIDGGEAYAVSAYSPDGGDTEPRITKVFGIVPFREVKEIYVVPDYMTREEDVAEMDLDDASKEKAASIIREANEMETRSAVEEASEVLNALPEWVFPDIHNREEAEAYVKAYRKTNRIKGSMPRSEESLKSYLYVMYNEIQKKIK